jgi:thiol-disulfide isomerase/thioredoxin
VLKIGIFAVVMVVIAAQLVPFFQMGGLLRDYEAAPELTTTAFMNTDQPLRLDRLRGQVVLLEFWTFDCINCVRTLPYMQNWHETYADQGLNVIGVHYPEFQYEHDFANIRAAAERLNITYPIALDSDGSTWRSYNQHYWPTMYLIDKQGVIRYFRIGEGAYDQTERAIQQLLAEDYAPPTTAPIFDPITYGIPTTQLNVRSDAGITNPLIGTVTENMAFIVLDERAGWYQIQYNDSIGWVFGEYLTIETS